MAPKKRSFIRKIPVLGQVHNDREKIQHQNAYFAALHQNSGYIEPTPSVGGWFKSKTPSKNSSITYITDTFPFLKWIRNYNLQWLLGDLIAGLTVGAVIIPKSMAYAKLAQLPVQYGLYTSVFGGAVYWLFGSSKDIAVGPVAVAAIVTAQIVADVTRENPDAHLAGPAIASAVAMLAGSLIAVLGLFRLGWLVDMISLPAVAAFITGSSITVVLGQFPALVGIQNVNSRDPAYKILINVIKKLGEIKIDAAFGISALLFLYGVKWICGRTAKQKPHLARKAFFISSMRAVSVVFIFTIISYILNRNRKENPAIHVIGFIPRGFQASPPSINKEILGSLISQVPLAAIVMLIEHISIGKEFGRINGYTINANSEFLAIGVTNILGPMVGAFAATGSVSGTAINAKAGARTPLCGVFTALVVVLSMYTMTPAFFFVPTSSLAAIIIHAIGDCKSQFRALLMLIYLVVTPPSTLYEFWKISPVDLLVFAIGLTITLFNSIENGVYAMIALSLLILLFRSFQARGSFLGSVRIRTVHTSPESSQALDLSTNEKMEETTFNERLADDERRVYLPLNREDGSNPKVPLESPEPGIFIYRLKEGLQFSNCFRQLDDLAEFVTENTRRGKPQRFENKGVSIAPLILIYIDNVGSPLERYQD
jgi:sodium-independent sulfate anion transporter 11